MCLNDVLERQHSIVLIKEAYGHGLTRWLGTHGHIVTFHPSIRPQPILGCAFCYINVSMEIVVHQAAPDESPLILHSVCMARRRRRPFSTRGFHIPQP